MKLTVIIPVFNEADSIPELFSELTPVCLDYQPFEIICIDDGSTDGSFDALCNIKEKFPQLKIVKFKGNHGKSDALAAGFSYARGEVVVTLDADLQNPPGEISRLLRALGDNDCAIGWRKDRHDNQARRFANGFRRFLLKDQSHDSACGLKAFRKEALVGLTIYKGMHRFLPALLRMRGCSIVEIKVAHRPRLYGHSKYGTWSRGVPGFIDLLFVLMLRLKKLTYKIERFS